MDCCKYCVLSSYIDDGKLLSLSVCVTCHLLLDMFLVCMRVCVHDMSVKDKENANLTFKISKQFACLQVNNHYCYTSLPKFIECTHYLLVFV